MKIQTVKNRFNQDHDFLCITLENKLGTSVDILNYGGILTSFRVVSGAGKQADIVLRFNDPHEYLGDHPYFGDIIGRYANRIAGGTFELDGKIYNLAKNNGPNHLHGGNKGFDKAFWNAEPATVRGNDALILKHTSPDGDEGYPGNLHVTVTYTLTGDDALAIEYQAKTDRPTVVNLTQHSYFNLDHPGREVYDHILQIRANRYLKIDENLIPTGQILDVHGTPFDFTAPSKIGDRIREVEPGYDHCFVFGHRQDDGLHHVEVTCASSGLGLQMFTTEPAMQFYTGNFLDGSLSGKEGIRYRKHSAFCLEAQHYPDSPNHPEFPGTVLHPGEIYNQKTVYKVIRL